MRVTSEGKPIGDVDLSFSPVDDAVLKHGDWRLPNLRPAFILESFCRPQLSVASELHRRDHPEESHRKRIIIGDGAKKPLDRHQSAQEFRTLGVLGRSLRPAAMASDFHFTARIISRRIGLWRSARPSESIWRRRQRDGASFKAASHQSCLAALSRDGDEVELRAVAQQKFSDSEEITVRL